MAYRAQFPTFAGGEVGRQVRARFDVSKYSTALDKARNTLGLPGGGQYNRPGLEFCDYTHDEAGRSELFTFSFSINQSYALEFSEGLMRVFYDGAPVTEAGLEISAISLTDPLTVTIPDHNYAIGDRIYFSGVEGTVEINGLTLRVTGVAGDVVTFGAVDATDWTAFTGSGGGEPGYTPPPADPPPPTYPDTDPDLPPRCVWVEAFIGVQRKAGQAQVGDALLMLSEADLQTYEGQITGLSLARRPCVRLESESGVVLTCSTTTPVPVLRGDAVIYLRAERVCAGDVVAVQDAQGFRWEPLVRVVVTEPKMVAQISANDGIYWAGDRPGRGIFTHNVKDGLFDPPVGGEPV